MSIEPARGSRLSPEFVLLGFLYGHPGYGYELHKLLSAEFEATWHLSQSQTYNILKRLIARGDISTTPVEQEKLPARQMLKLSVTGRERFEAWLETPTQCSVHAIRVEFVSRLYFIQKYQPGKIAWVIQQQQEQVEQGLAQLRKSIPSAENAKSFNRLALDLRLQLLESILTWLETCQQELAPGSGE